MQTPDTTAAGASRAQQLAEYHSRIRSRYTEQQQVAISLLYEVATRHLGTSGGNTCAKLLLGLYNGNRFPFDLTDLRLLDAANFEAAMTVLRMDARHTYCEVHVLLDAIYADGRYTGDELELWAWDLRLKGRSKKDAIDELRARVSVRRQGAAS